MTADDLGNVLCYHPLGSGRAGFASRRHLALQLPFPKISESMGNHDSKIVDAGSVD
jgi:hypothetical protein